MPLNGSPVRSACLRAVVGKHSELIAVELLDDLRVLAVAQLERLAPERNRALAHRRLRALLEKHVPRQVRGLP